MELTLGNWLRSTSVSPLFGLVATLLAFFAASRLQRRMGGHPLFHPVLPAIVVIAVFLWLLHIPAARYFSGAQIIHFLLGPATVALAVPLYAQLHHVRRALVPVLFSIVIGSMTAAGSAVLLAKLLGASRVTILSLAPKSVSTPIAMGVAGKIGGDPGRTVLFVVVTGVLGAIIGSGLFKLLRIRDSRAIGLGMGVASHGVGTSRALQIDETAGAFSSLAMGLTGIITAVLLPIFARLLA